MYERPILLFLLLFLLLDTVKPLRTILLTLNCALIALAHCSLAQTNETQIFRGKAAEFTITVPTNWVEIDPQLVEALVDPYAEDYSAGGATAAHYGYGPPISDDITNPPYIAIDVRKFRRLPERLVALHANDAILKTNLTRVLKKSGILQRNILEISYDTNKYRVKVSATRVTEGNRERLHITRFTFFTEEGAIGVTAVCPELDWPAWTNTIQTAFDSFQLADRLRYRPRAPVTPVKGSGLAAFLVILFAFVGVPILYMIYKRNVGQVMSDEI